LAGGAFNMRVWGRNARQARDTAHNPVVRGSEEPVEVLDGVVLVEAVADQASGDALLAQKV
jgi:hypothetical protein